MRSANEYIARRLLPWVEALQWCPLCFRRENWLPSSSPTHLWTLTATMVVAYRPVIFRYVGWAIVMPSCGFGGVTVILYSAILCQRSESVNLKYYEE